MNRIKEPLKRFTEYSDSTTTLTNKKSTIFFVDENFKPLSVNKLKIASTKDQVPYLNHLEFLPRSGDHILVGNNSYVVSKVVHSLPAMRSDVQKIYIILK